MEHKMAPVVKEVMGKLHDDPDHLDNIAHYLETARRKYELDADEAQWLKVEMIKRIPSYRG
jgi:hypothetical protein